LSRHPLFLPHERTLRKPVTLPGLRLAATSGITLGPFIFWPATPFFLVRKDFVFTVCDDAANEVCPIWPGQPMSAHWGIPEPAKAEGTEAEKAFAFDDTMRMLSASASS